MKYGLYLGIFMLSSLTIVSIVRSVVFLYKLNKHLREKHTEKWKYLTTIPGFGPGCKNDLRVLKFLFSKDDLGDPELLHFKIIARNSIIYMVTGLGAVSILLFMLAQIYPKL